MSGRSTNLDWAIDYANLGWHVFPVSKEKTPLTQNGFKDASIDHAQIRAWWTKNPDAGIGVATGVVSGIVVLDVDLDKPGTEEALGQLIQTRGQLPQDVVARTGGGGYHFYFLHPGKETIVHNAQRLFGLAGIDVRGDGGYVVVPPSGHKSGNFYEWGTSQSPFESHLPECPPYIYEERRKTTSFSFDDTIPDGARNSTLASIAGLMRSLGFNHEEILAMLRQQNERRCNPPLPDSEVEVIASHVAMYPPRPNRNDENAANQIDADALLRYEKTDDGFAKMIAFVHMGHIKYDHSRGKWLLWRGQWWKPDYRLEIYEEVRYVIEAYRRAAEMITNVDAKEEGMKYVRSMSSKIKMDQAVALARSLTTVSTISSDWDIRPALVGVTNGVLDLKTGELRDGHPQDYISQHIPIEYDKTAGCPNWLKFLDDVFSGDKDVIQFVQNAVGYSLTAENREQCMMMLVGNGSNGKSIFLSVLLALSGEYGLAAPFTTFVRNLAPSSNTNDVASLAGKRLVTASETNEGVSIDEARIKSLTGGEMMSARFLHQEFFQFRPFAKIWLGVNHLPRVHDESDGFWRRVRRIDFPNRFVDRADAKPGDKIRDYGLLDRLMAELPGILAWAVRGAETWYRNGLQVPQSIRVSTSNYRKDSDPLEDFFLRYCDRGEEYAVDSDLVFKAYLAWTRQRMMKSYEVLSSTRFHGRLSRDFHREDAGGVKRYVGISLKPEGVKLSEDTGAATGGLTINRVSKSK